jgi:dihydropyrimidinase
LVNDDLQTVCSDHCGATAEQKAKSADDFRWIEPGLAGIQTHGMVVFSEGVSKGRISLERFVQVMSTNPARLFGLYPRKGILAPGSDADLIIIDPDATWTVEPEQMYVEWGYSPNAGQRVVGRPVAVIQAGRAIVEDGEFKGTRGSGRYLARQASIPPID